MATHTVVAKGSLGADYIESPPSSGNYLVEAGFTIDLDTAPFSSGENFIFSASAVDLVKFEDSSGTTTVNIDFQTSNSNDFLVEFKDDIDVDITIGDGVNIFDVVIDAWSAGSVDMMIGNNVSLEEFKGSNGGADNVIIGDNFTMTKDFQTDNGDDSITIGQNASVPKFDAGGVTDTAITQTPGASITNAESIHSPDGVVQGTTGDDAMSLGYADIETDQIGTGDNIIEGPGGNDTITGFFSSDTIYGDFQIALGGLSDDPMPTQSGGPNEDVLSLGSGAIKFELDNDTGQDETQANDILFTDGTGGDQLISVSIEWIGNNDEEQDISRFDLSSFDDDFTVTIKDEGEEDTIIFGGVEMVNVNSAASVDDETAMIFTFSEKVENVQFRLRDFERDLGEATITAFDAAGNPIAFNVTEGSTVYGSDSDAVAGNDTFSASASGSQNGDHTQVGSILVEIPGPVASIQIDYVSNNGSLTMTDIYFNAPPVLTEDGDDTIYAGTDDDTILAGTGTDTGFGGSGTDTYDAQNQSILIEEAITVTVDDTGGGTFSKTNDGTSDTVTSVDTYVADENAGSDTITLTTDYLAGDVTGLNDNAVGTFTPAGPEPAINFGPAEAWQLSDILNGTAPGGPDGTYQITSGDEAGQIGNITFQNFETIDFGVICFVRGTTILTDSGEVAIESLQTGDRVMTMDHGLQPIRWIGSTRVLATGDLAPIRISAGALDNTRDLLVSPQHRMMLSGWQMELLFAEPEVLAPAQMLVNDTTIRCQTGGIVEYFHVLFDGHEIVFAEGAPSESYHPGRVGLGSLAEASRAEILSLFPELGVGGENYGATARMSLRSHETRVAIDALNFAGSEPASRENLPAVA